MLAEGSTVGCRYRLTSLIGEGGMASVWRASDETLQRSVAIKLLYFRAHRDPQHAVEQFLREARIAASIQHRNVVQTVDFGTTDDGIPYMVMELLHGESLATRMEREPRLSPQEFVRVASLTLRGLAAVHDAGIVHRDLKPQNIFLEQDGDAWYPKILDFGISRSMAAHGQRPSAIATQQGLVIGTPHYMSPEQARGEAEIDKRSDIYSMGAIIYEALTGRVPFDAETPGELLVKILSGDPPPMRAVHPDVPELLSDCVAQAMAHDREHRFVDARVFRRALQSAAEGAFPEGAQHGSEVPENKPPAARVEAPAAALQVAPATLQAANDVRAPAWGDFEGLRGRSEPTALAHAQTPAAPPPARGGPHAAPAPLSAAGGQRAATGPLVGGAAAAPRAATGPLAGGAVAPRAATGPLAGGAVALRAATGPLAGGAVAPRAATGPLAGGAVAPRAATGPLAGGAVAPQAQPGAPATARVALARAPSAPLARPAQVKAASPPNATPHGVAADDGPLMGDNPLDAFSDTAGALLDIDYGPAGDPRVSRQSPLPRAAKRAGATGVITHEDRKAGARTRRHGPSALWILPALLLLVVFIVLLAPGLFSAAPPDQSAAMQQEAQNPATRSSDRRLSTSRADDLAKPTHDAPY
jgi:eukaryotic-like serine/threonine-protein kinase